ncbi:cell division protein FtsL [bacterium]
MKRQYFKIILFLGIFTGGLLIYVWERFEAVNICYEIQNLDTRSDNLHFDISRLELKLNKLSDLKRIEKIAVDNLGMISPGEKDIVILKVRK